MDNGSKSRNKWQDLIVVGGGASGLFLASLVTRAGIGTTLLESGAQIGRKLAASGGGHANFSNSHVAPENYLCRSADNFCARALENFGSTSFMDIIKAWGLPTEERDHGRLFLQVPAIRLVRVLKRECLAQGCELIVNETVTAAKPLPDGFKISTKSGVRYCRKLVLAMGSRARPDLAGPGLDLAQSFGHHTIPLAPALTPLLYGAATPLAREFGALAGIAVPVRLSLEKAAYPHKELAWQDSLLFTHRGLSGPAALQASLFWQSGAVASVDFLPGNNFERLLDLDGNASRAPRSILREYLPARLVDTLLPPQLANVKCACISRKNRQFLGNRVNALKLPGLHPAGLARAEVCSGGVDCAEIDPLGMESRIMPNLHIVGEMLDVTGELGGYNLHWAFASAFCAAQAIIGKHYRKNGSYGKNKKIL